MSSLPMKLARGRLRDAMINTLDHDKLDVVVDRCSRLIVI